MMKGDEEPEMAIGVMVITFGVVAILGFLQVNIIITSTNIDVARGEMEAVDIAHVLVKCLEDDGLVHVEDLSQESLETCGLKSMFVLLTDIETGEEIWKSGEPHGNNGYSLQVPVQMEDGTIVGGDLYVKI